jgi:D-lactate dehydrogenase
MGHVRLKAPTPPVQKEGSTVRVAVFSTKPYDRRFLAEAAPDDWTLEFFEPHLDSRTVGLAAGFDATCCFVNDVLDAAVLDALAAGGTRIVALRCAGYNNVDVDAAHASGVSVLRVPSYSPDAVAEHAVALMLGLNRRIHRAFNRVREGNFSIDGLLGFTMAGRTAGIVGTGQIGRSIARILRGFDCRLIATDPAPDDAWATSTGVEYVPFETLLEQSDIVTLHCPLTPATHHLVDDAAIARMRPGTMLVNTSRGAVVDSGALIRGIKDGTLGFVGLDVYEEEGDLFFDDLSDQVLQDDVLARLMTFPNVLITSHQAFFTVEAMREIAGTTIANITAAASGSCDPANVVARRHMASTGT